MKSKLIKLMVLGALFCGESQAESERDVNCRVLSNFCVINPQLPCIAFESNDSDEQMIINRFAKYCSSGKTKQDIINIAVSQIVKTLLID